MIVTRHESEHRGGSSYQECTAPAADLSLQLHKSLTAFPERIMCSSRARKPRKLNYSPHGLQLQTCLAGIKCWVVRLHGFAAHHEAILLASEKEFDPLLLAASGRTFLWRGSPIASNYAR